MASPFPTQLQCVDGSSQFSKVKTTCDFYLKKKRRCCKFPLVEGSQYCAQHLCPSESGELIMNDKKRIPCPLDTNHTVFEDRLESHLKKCNFKPNKMIYEVRDLNLGEELEPAQIQLSDVCRDKLTDLVDRISKLCRDKVQIMSDTKEHPLLRHIIYNPVHKKCLKHRVQEASLLGHMAALDWLEDGKLYLEFGAGRAKLSSHLLEICSKHINSKLVVIDRYHTRGKCENKYKENVDGPTVERVKIDIKDFDIEKFLSVSPYSHKQILGYSKHLCGAATDLTLRCLQPLMASSGRSEDMSSSERTEDMSTRQPSEKRLRGLLIALCCHHRCTWQSYVGKSFWLDNGLTEEDFPIIRALSSWATCAFPRLVGEETMDDNEHDLAEHSIPPPQDGRHDIWTIDEKEKIGYNCKRVIDAGRAAFMSDNGYKTDFIKYVDQKYSLENVLVIAMPQD